MFKIYLVAIATAAATSCAVPAKAPFEAVKVPAAKERVIDVPTIINELDESGCEIAGMTYEHGKRKSTVTVRCVSPVVVP